MTRKEAEIKIEQLNEAKAECNKLMKELNVKGSIEYTEPILIWSQYQLDLAEENEWIYRDENGIPYFMGAKVIIQPQLPRDVILCQD